MLTQERYAIILDYLKEKNAVTVAELTKILGSSESTVRRDLSALDEAGQLKKVRGGATRVHTSAFTTSENDVIYKHTQMETEKRAIGTYAVRLITPHDFVYIDAGTTTECLVDAIAETQAVFITNGLIHAKKLMNKGCQVHVIEGVLRRETEAIVGAEALECLMKYHFTKGFFGTNGIDIDSGYTTPDTGEAMIKREAFRRSYKAYVLADSTKFNQVTPVTFGNLKDGIIITEKLTDHRYVNKTKIVEV